MHHSHVTEPVKLFYSLFEETYAVISWEIFSRDLNPQPDLEWEEILKPHGTRLVCLTDADELLSYAM